MKDGMMAGQQLVINARFFENGTCAYEVLKDGQQLDHNIVGIVSNWEQLLQVIGGKSFALVTQTPRAE